MKTKICNKCNKNKPVSEFYKDKYKKDGYSTICIECVTKYHQEHRADILEYKRKYRNSLAKYDIYYDRIYKYYEPSELRRDPNNSDLLQVKCKYCGRWFNPSNIELDHRIESIEGRGRGERHLYCSKSCKTSCPTYNQTKYPKDFKQGTSREVYPELRKIVLKLDDWTCMCCGKSKEDFPELELHCHHIHPVVSNPMLEADPANCITFCKECHQWIHNTVPGCSLKELRKCSTK